MPIKYSIGVRGIRSGRWSESKWTNCNEFDPGRVEIGQVMSKGGYALRNGAKLKIIRLPTHPAFLMPINKRTVRETLASVPSEFLTGLSAVFLLRGSKKQEKVFKSRFCYGRYSQNVIFIHPYPKKYMVQKWSTLPKPSVLNEYERAGAKVTPDGEHWCIQFDEASLKQFYLRDVLLHELGHHVDSANFRFKTNQKAEGFAEWFASEYGFRLRQRQDT